jgi:hypothetical protein
VASALSGAGDAPAGPLKRVAWAGRTPNSGSRHPLMARCARICQNTP